MVSKKPHSHFDFDLEFKVHYRVRPSLMFCDDLQSL